MKIDRSRFLMLTGALSAATALGAAAVSGCSSTAATDNADSGTTPTDSGTTTDGSTPDASDAGSDAATACLGDTAPDAGDTTDGGDDGGLGCSATTDLICQSYCNSAFANLRPGVAAEVAACIVALPTCEGTTIDVVADCFDKSAVKACADTTAATYCDTLFTACGADGGLTDPDGGADAGVFTKANCVALATALSDTGRAAFQSCVVEGLNCNDPSVCVTSIKH